MRHDLNLIILYILASLSVKCISKPLTSYLKIRMSGGFVVFSASKKDINWNIGKALERKKLPSIANIMLVSMLI